MMKKLLVTALAAGLMTSPMTFAKGTNAGDQVEGAPVTTSLSSLSLAHQLASLGMAKEDPMLLVSAARLIQSVPKETREATKTSEGGQDDSGTKAGVAYTVDALLAKATELAGSDEALLALISDTKDSASSRGRVGGAVRGHTDRVRANATDRYTIEFRGGEMAELAVSGDGDTDLDLFIYDENGNEICTDTDYTDQLYCRWNPRWTGPFTVRIRNLGNVYNEYELYTN